MTDVWNEGEMSPGGREMATSSGEREKRRPGLMTVASGAGPRAVGTERGRWSNW